MRSRRRVGRCPFQLVVQSLQSLARVPSSVNLADTMADLLPFGFFRVATSPRVM